MKMMKGKTLNLLVFLGILACVVMACEKQHPGIEVGNPEEPLVTPVLGKFIIVEPIVGDEDYLIEVSSASEAKLSLLSQSSRAQGLAERIVETVTASLEEEGDRFLILQVMFSTGRRILIRINFIDEALGSILIMPDGTLVDATLELRESLDAASMALDSCSSGANNNLLWFVDSICTRFNGCDASIACDTCRTAILDLVGQLHDNLGLANEPPYTEMAVRELAEGIAAQTLPSNRTHATRCLADVDALTCNELTAELNQVAQGDYSAVQEIVPAGSHSCAGFFTFDTEERPGSCQQGSATNPLAWFVDGLCTNLKRCDGNVACDACRTDVFLLRGTLHDELGLPDTIPYSQLTVRELVDRLELGLIAADHASLTQCLADLDTASCETLDAAALGESLSTISNSCGLILSE